jgi:hypothetical protein
MKKKDLKVWIIISLKNNNKNNNIYYMRQTKRSKTKRSITKRSKTKKRGGFFSFFKKNKVQPLQSNFIRNEYAGMNSTALHKLYQEKCKKHMGFVKNMSSECKKIDKEFQKKIKEENNRNGNYIDVNDFDDSKSERENLENRYMTGITLPPNSKSKFKCREINLNNIEKVNYLKDIYGDCCPSGFFGKKNTTFCKNVEKKIEKNRYYYPENPTPKEEISDEEYEMNKEFATNPVAGYRWQNPENGTVYYDTEAYNQEQMYYEELNRRKEEKERNLLEISQRQAEMSERESTMLRRERDSENIFSKPAAGGKTMKKRKRRT